MPRAQFLSGWTNTWFLLKKWPAGWWFSSACRKETSLYIITITISITVTLTLTINCCCYHWCYYRYYCTCCLTLSIVVFQILTHPVVLHSYVKWPLYICIYVQWSCSSRSNMRFSMCERSERCGTRFSWAIARSIGLMRVILSRWPCYNIFQCRGHANTNLLTLEKTCYTSRFQV